MIASILREGYFDPTTHASTIMSGQTPSREQKYKAYIAYYVDIAYEFIVDRQR